MSRFLIQMAVLVAAVAGSAAYAHEHPDFFLDKQNVALASFGLIVLGALLFRSRREASEIRLVSSRWSIIRNTLAAVAAWSAVAALGVVAIKHREALMRVGDKMWTSSAGPELVSAFKGGEIILQRGHGGHFTARVQVEGAPLDMLVDTGSSDIALPFELAREIGIDMDALVFDNPVMTANGQAMVAPVTLAEVSIGDIALVDVEASVAEPGRLASALLGMSFLGQLQEVSLRGDKLFLRK